MMLIFVKLYGMQNVLTVRLVRTQVSISKLYYPKSLSPHLPPCIPRQNCPYQTLTIDGFIEVGFISQRSVALHLDPGENISKQDHDQAHKKAWFLDEDTECLERQENRKCLNSMMGRVLSCINYSRCDYNSVLSVCSQVSSPDSMRSTRRTSS